jgi:hypothetical protein
VPASWSITAARNIPRVAVSLPGVVLAIQFVIAKTWFSSTFWRVYFAIFLVGLIVSATASGHIGWLSPPITVGYLVAITLLVVIPALSDGCGWTSWVSVGAGKSVGLGRRVSRQDQCRRSTTQAATDSARRAHHPHARLA